MLRFDHVRRITWTMARTRTRGVCRDNTELGARLTAAVVSILVPATATGFALGLGLRAVIRRSRFVARYKPFLVLLGTVAYFAALVVLMGGDGSTGALGVALALFEVGPIGWYAELATLAVGPTNVAAASGAIAFAALLSLLATAVGSWLAARVWYVSRASPDAQTGSSVGRTLPGVSPRTDQIVQKVWRRIRRSPARLLYAAYPLLGVGFVVVQTGSLDTVPPFAAVLVALYGAWATGSALTLNPLGDESDALSLTLASGTSGAEYVRARWLAGTVPGALVTGGVTALVALFAGLAPRTVLLLTVAGSGLAALAPGLACGIGTLFPRTEATTVVRGYQAVVPSTVAFAAYSLAQTVLTLPLLVVTPELTPTVTRSTGLPVGTVETVGVTAALGLLAVGSVASYRVAVARFDRYTLD